MGRSFNGSTDVITVTSASPLNPTSQVSMSCWANLNGATQNFANLIGKMAAATWAAPYAVYSLGFTSGLQIRTWINDGSVSTNYVNGSIAPPANGWFHAVGTYDGTTLALYMNAQSAGTTTIGAALSTSTQNLMIGNVTGNNGAFPGYIADAAVWNVGLSSGQVASLYSGVRPTYVANANLVGWWPLDGYASPEPDLSGNSNNGALTGTARIIGPPQLWRLSA